MSDPPEVEGVSWGLQGVMGHQGAALGGTVGRSSWSWTGRQTTPKLQQKTDMLLNKLGALTTRWFGG